MNSSEETLLRSMFDAAVSAADPLKIVKNFLPPKPKGRIVVLGAGKASARMAQAVEREWGPCEGIVLVPYGAWLPCEKIKIVEASHPVPDTAGHQGTQDILNLAESLGPDDFCLCLISGGGSALLTAPAKGISLADKQAVNSALLSSGAAIDQMNVIRKHLSRIKGGRLAKAAYPARILTLTISDVPGDDPSSIASGPTVPDTRTAQDALDIIERFKMDVPNSVLAVLKTDAAQSPNSHDPYFENAKLAMIATPQIALEAAAQIAGDAGVIPVILGDALEGEAAEMGKVMAGIAKQVLRHGQPASGRVALISGGEATVTVRGDCGKGGRCSEFLLALALHLWDTPNITALAADTDGRDGSEDNAGALWSPKHRALAHREDAIQHLARHDAFSFFDKLDALVHTGPTHTNVNDFRVILVETAVD